MPINVEETLIDLQNQIDGFHPLMGDNSIAPWIFVAWGLIAFCLGILCGRGTG